MKVLADRISHFSKSKGIRSLRSEVLSLFLRNGLLSKSRENGDQEIVIAITNVWILVTGGQNRR